MQISRNSVFVRFCDNFDGLSWTLFFVFKVVAVAVAVVVVDSQYDPIEEIAGDGLELSILVLEKRNCEEHMEVDGVEFEGVEPKDNLATDEILYVIITWYFEWWMMK